MNYYVIILWIISHHQKKARAHFLASPNATLPLEDYQHWRYVRKQANVNITLGIVGCFIGQIKYYEQWHDIWKPSKLCKYVSWAIVERFMGSSSYNIWQAFNEHPFFIYNGGKAQPLLHRITNQFRERNSPTILTAQ